MNFVYKKKLVKEKWGDIQRAIHYLEFINENDPVKLKVKRTETVTL